MTKRKYAGTWTALITPFKKDPSCSVDEESLRGLVRRQAEAGVTGVVPIGTTGESPTTTAEEDERIFTIVVEEARKIAENGGRKIMVMAGTGSNCTREAIKHTEAAKRAGADACLVVTPYYNKPTPKGLKLHFKAVADLGLPVIVYNIKGRTGINIDTDTLMEIAAHPMVAGVKEASGDLAQMKEVLRRREELEGGKKAALNEVADGSGMAGGESGGREFAVLCGDDGLTLELMKMRPEGASIGEDLNFSENARSWGGDGVISVASNLVPGEVAKMVGLAAEGKFEEAGVLNEKLTRLFKEIFVETNPIPVKYIASRMGLCELSYRLPMCEPSEKAVAVLEELMKVYGLA